MFRWNSDLRRAFLLRALSVDEWPAHLSTKDLLNLSIPSLSVSDQAQDSKLKNHRILTFIAFYPASSYYSSIPTTSSHILLSRGVADTVPDTQDSNPSSAATPLITLLENVSTHILNLSPPLSYEDTVHAPEINSMSTTRHPTTAALNEEASSYMTAAPMYLPLTSSNESFIPLRPKASPHSTQSNSPCSSVSEDPESIPISGEQSPRGRSPVRLPARQRNFSEAIPRRRTGGLWSVNFGSGSSSGSQMQRSRVLSRDLFDEPEDMGDSIMEPMPPDRFRVSISEQFYRATTFDSSIDLTNFGDHRDTFALLGFRPLKRHAPELPKPFFSGLLSYIDFETYLAIRLACRCWSDAITSVCPLVPRLVMTLPAEVLENIFARLTPVDFNAARHTCRTWMIASLEKKLLTLMLERGNWSGAVVADLAPQKHRPQRLVSSVSEEWSLSKRLAFECSLLPDWTGNGLPEAASEGNSSPTSLALVSTIDFSELSNGGSERDVSQQDSAQRFTVSACNKFVLVFEGCVLYIYSLRGDDAVATSHPYGGHLHPFTSIVCPRSVRAVSMDTSSQRLAVAILMEGREGMVCDLQEHPTVSQRGPGVSISRTAAVPDFGTSVDNSTLSDDVTEGDSTEAALAENYIESTHATSTRRNVNQFPLHLAIRPQHQASPFTHTGRVPFETGHCCLYHNICSTESYPRSVAICPQRRCVAFGCTEGIELHWVDALTNQSLNRWFPLTTPSDFLYFLPPRPGLDSPRRLRLISSAAASRNIEHLQEDGFFPGNHYGMGWDTVLNEPGVCEVWDGEWRRGGWCDHYRAVPISDGWNVLFTDPEDGMLCLGSDAPPGARPTKMMKKYIFIGPQDWNHSQPIAVPRVYSAGRELKWGVRVVAGYGERVWLFSIAPDVFFGDVHEHKVHEAHHQANGVSVGNSTPLMIGGREIGTVPGLVDVALDASAGDITIWAFAAGGMAYVWQMAGRSRQRAVLKRRVLQDGSVVDMEDDDGDFIMRDLPPQRKAVHFDGTAASVRPAVEIPTPKDYIPPTLVPVDMDMDGDGDTRMRDAPAPANFVGDEGYASADDDDDEIEQAVGPFAIHVSPLWGDWNEEDGDGDADWVPDYLDARRGDSEVEDGELGFLVLEMSRVEVEIL